MSNLTYSGMTFAELVAETLRRWKSERDSKMHNQLVEHDEPIRLHFHFWNYLIGHEDLTFMRQRLEQQVPCETPMELVFSHCTFMDSTLVVDCLKDLIAHRNLEVLHFVERHASMTYSNVAEFLHKTQNLRELTFSFQNHPGASEILQARGAQTLQALTVDAVRAPMETIYVQELVDGLKTIPLLKCINLQGLNCNDESLVLVVQAVLAMENLQELKLDLRDASLTYASLATLAMLLNQLPEGTSVQLYIWDTQNLFSKAKQHHLDDFSTSLEKCRASISVFSLQDVGIQRPHLVRLFQALEHMNTNQNNNAMEVEITATGFAQDPITFCQLMASISQMTGIKHLEIEDENMWGEWGAERDLELLAALERNPRIESMSFWAGTRDRIDVMKASTSEIFQRNRSLATVSRLGFPSQRESFPDACLGHLLETLSKQAGPSAGDPVYKVLQHSVHLLLNSKDKVM